MLIPIGTDLQARSRPVGNWILLASNVLIFFLLGGTPAAEALKEQFVLNAALPVLSEYLTYQFLHGDVGHLTGNMLFLWIFGNAVCDRMGSLAYILFYLSGGTFAGVVFAWTSDYPLLGASGSIAAVTAAFMVLFPRARITMLLWMFIVTTFQVPAIALIALKVILWDNVIAPWLDRGQGIVSNVAYTAHIGGYVFGLAVPLVLQALGGLPRNSFDLLGLMSRWYRRQGSPLDLGGSAPRPVLARPAGGMLDEEEPTLTEGQRIREAVVDRLAAGDGGEAVSLYTQMRRKQPELLLPRPQQAEISRLLTQAGRYADAAEACGRYLAAWPGGIESGEVHLLLGWLLARHLGAGPLAVSHLEQAAQRLTQPTQRALALEELERVRAQLTQSS